MAALGPDCRLIIFTRYPEPGVTKTRLIPALGAEGAADLHRRMTLHTLEWAAELRRQEGVDIEVRFTGGDPRKMAAMFGDEFRYVPQGDGDLGERLERAFMDAIQDAHGTIQGAHRDGQVRCIAIGTDCPGVTAQVMRQALLDLRRRDVVIGPATDGGYYLIGLWKTAYARALFRQIDWGTGLVLEQTLAAARGVCARMSMSILERLDDVDRPEDLPVWERARRDVAPPGLRGRVAVIIPTLNEAEQLPATLQRVCGLDDVQVVVADGGSSDGTPGIARSFGVMVVESGRGRGLQMNAGAAAADADVLVFCHADTRLPVGFERLVRRTLHIPGVIAGAFALRIDGDGPGLRRVERGVAWRSRHLRLPYGDQALFLRRSTFEELGGFAPLPLMEDYHLVRRLRRRGRIAILDQPVTTSGRAWQRAGVLRATAANQLVIAGYHLGIPSATLARFRRWALSRKRP